MTGIWSTLVNVAERRIMPVAAILHGLDLPSRLRTAFDSSQPPSTRIVSGVAAAGSIVGLGALATVGAAAAAGAAGVAVPAAVAAVAWPVFLATTNATIVTSLFGRMAGVLPRSSLPDH